MILETGKILFTPCISNKANTFIRLEEEDEEVSKLSLDDIKKAAAASQDSYWWLDGGFSV